MLEFRSDHLLESFEARIVLVGVLIGAGCLGCFPSGSRDVITQKYELLLVVLATSQEAAPNLENDGRTAWGEVQNMKVPSSSLAVLLDLRRSQHRSTVQGGSISDEDDITDVAFDLLCAECTKQMY
ncbi:hypothetical protein CVT26_008840 [Gymnopilus dilepis]|uniref:Uncharacterized protein n=1 Tax=Gymnopilus dilepis TaxID=231916 RepID=A0A409YGD7_9AGAR|nr:hypothetical protein CVT26_008840 [Gymnopilus dilepis]